MRIFCLSAEQIDSCWHDIASLLEQFQRQCCSIPLVDIQRAARESKMQVWGLQTDTAVHGVVVTEIQRTTQGLICLLVLACGKAPLLERRRILEVIRSWADAQGCQKLRIQGRRGWLRFDRSFEQTGVIMEAPCRI